MIEYIASIIDNCLMYSFQEVMLRKEYIESEYFNEKKNLRGIADGNIFYENKKIRTNIF